MDNIDIQTDEYFKVVVNKSNLQHLTIDSLTVDAMTTLAKKKVIKAEIEEGVLFTVATLTYNDNRYIIDIYFGKGIIAKDFVIHVLSKDGIHRIVGSKDVATFIESIKNGIKFEDITFEQNYKF